MPDRDRQVQNGPVAAGHDDAELVAALVRGDEAGPSVDSERFFPPGHPDAGHWISELPRRTVDALPPAWPWSSPCVTSRGGAPRRSVTSWESRTPTSECGSIGRGPAPEANSSGI